MSDTVVVVEDSGQVIRVYGGLPGPKGDQGEPGTFDPDIPTPKVTFDVAAGLTPAVGEMVWDAAEGTVSIGMNHGGVVLQVGQEMYYRVKNTTGTLITDGTPVKAVGAVGNSGHILIAPATADSNLKPDTVMGLVTADIAHGAEGFVTAFGVVRGIDTTGTSSGEVWTDGDMLYLSATTGKLTKTQPASPLPTVLLAYVLKAGNSGSLFARPTYGHKLSWLNDVALTTPEEGDMLKFVNGVWVNVDSYSTGYFDLTPVWVKDDGSGGWAFSTIANGRKVLAASGTGGAKTLVAEYHIPHDIKLGMVEGEAFFHLHCEFENQAAGNVIITVDMWAAPPNGLWSGPVRITYTLTPANYAIGANHIIEAALPPALLPYLEPDAVFSCNIARDPSIVTDTYGGSFYFITADLHIKGDNKLTTAKDKGTGWVKA